MRPVQHPKASVGLDGGKPTTYGFKEVSALLRYDPETGDFFWRPRPLSMFDTVGSGKIWNGLYANKPAFTTINSHGYRRSYIFGVHFYAHRVAWLLSHGEWPKDQIDHIDGDRLNNRIANLQDVSNAENGRNRGIITRNTSGVMGVSWNRHRGCWTATIRVNGRPKALGGFSTKEEAAAARTAANERYGYAKTHGARLARPEGRVRDAH